MTPTASTDLIALSADPLDVRAALSHVTSAGAGGINIFVGTTRNDRDPSLGSLVALEYEAHEDLALAEIGRIIVEARRKWPVVAAAVLHRTGRVALGEASVIIAVACPHRGEAFDACRYVIDALKSRAPIWKRDVYDAGARWRHDAPAPS